ncbi:hypothetical protein ONS95_010717 [Cadophora gregata]|uniref:uncharacterized protein n=1 Tax=Cadophora gregata TaxID=51156 RepID=UPI0026DAD87B|nr:uncharacterized protein ONS95_010717 [Cadophora gregata]KAK0122486.1 hypothetical protein ONS95_010717 [Cadophora gregata]KAK0127963.1 hypothetical protein ONS96_007460 [Cadophora gregata f. sp. sojae]
MFYTEDNCIGSNPLFLKAQSYPQIPDEIGLAASFRCCPLNRGSSLARERSRSQDLNHVNVDKSFFHTENRPNGQPNGTVKLYTYPNFKGQYTKFRVFPNHCYFPPRKLRNSVKSLIISDKIDSCTFWSEPGCKGDPYWLGAGRIEDLKNEGSSFVSFECLLVGDEDPEGVVGDGDGDGGDEGGNGEVDSHGLEMRRGWDGLGWKDDGKGVDL